MDRIAVIILVVKGVYLLGRKSSFAMQVDLIYIYIIKRTTPYIGCTINDVGGKNSPTSFLCL